MLTMFLCTRSAASSVKEECSLQPCIACPCTYSCVIAFTSLRMRACACRCSAQGMLDLSDSTLLQQCHEAASAAEGQLEHRPNVQSAHALAATEGEPVTGTARRDQAQQSRHLNESAIQLKSQPERAGEPLPKADKQVRPSAQMASGKVVETSNGGPAANQIQSLAESAMELNDVERLVSSAATVSTGEAASPPSADDASAQLCLPASTRPARSLLDVLLGDPPPLPAVSALAVLEQPASGGRSYALQEPEPLDASDLVIDKHAEKLPASFEPTTAEPARRPLQDARPEESRQSESSPQMHPAAPSPDSHAGSTLLQPEQGPVKKLLSLRERLALLKGST